MAEIKLRMPMSGQSQLVSSKVTEGDTVGKNTGRAAIFLPPLEENFMCCKENALATLGSKGKT